MAPLDNVMRRSVFSLPVRAAIAFRPRNSLACRRCLATQSETKPYEQSDSSTATPSLQSEIDSALQLASEPTVDSSSIENEIDSAPQFESEPIVYTSAFEVETEAAPQLESEPIVNTPAFESGIDSAQQSDSIIATPSSQIITPLSEKLTPSLWPATFPNTFRSAYIQKLPRTLGKASLLTVVDGEGRETHHPLSEEQQALVQQNPQVDFSSRTPVKAKAPAAQYTRGDLTEKQVAANAFMDRTSGHPLSRRLSHAVRPQLLVHVDQKFLRKEEREQQAELSKHKRIIGVVISAGKMDRTVKVRVAGQTWNRRIKKNFRDDTNHLVHDPNNSLIVGDVIELHRLRCSKLVHHVVGSIISPHGTPIAERPPIPTPADRLASYKEARLAKLERRVLRVQAADGDEAAIAKLKELGLHSEESKEYVGKQSQAKVTVKAEEELTPVQKSKRQRDLVWYRQNKKKGASLAV